MIRPLSDIHFQTQNCHLKQIPLSGQLLSAPGFGPRFEVQEIYQKHQYGASKKGGNGGGQKGFVNDESKCMDSIGEVIGDESNPIKLVIVTAKFAWELMTKRGIERLTAGKREETV